MHSEFHTDRDNKFITGLSFKARKRVFDRFMGRFSQARTIIDVGVTSERHSIEANFLEKFHPHKDRITAVGIEDASHLESLYPGMTFRKVEPGARLPFADEAFDVAYSHAVIEHIVDDRERRAFVLELLRVAKSVFITTPNKFFPVETHTKVPLLHFVWPSLFYKLLDKRIISRFYSSANLRLLSETDLGELFSRIPRIKVEIESVSLAGIPSNLLAIISKTDS